MSVTSVSFLGFAIGVAILHALWGNPAWRQALMLVSNVAFVLSFTTSVTALAPYAAFLMLAYVSVRSAQFTRGPLPTFIFIAGTTFLFLWLKKYWFISAAVGFLPFAYFTVGLSYVFFRVMGLILDARQDERLARVGPVKFFNFAMNFPTLIAGPIDRFQDFSKPHLPITMPDIGNSLYRIVQGFFKVIVLSYVFGVFQEQGARFLLNVPGFDNRLLNGILAIGSYPLQLYFNSSGYADIVIAIGVLFGKRYPENFARPFLAFSFIEFWSRYHMSLSFWLRDYIYTPLLTAMMRKVPNPAFDPFVGAVSYFVTFFLIGIWHGSTVAFAIYGLLLAIGVSINKLHQVYLTKYLGRKAYRELSGRYPYRSTARGLTYAYYAFCMIFFWADIATATQVFERLGISGMLVCTAAILVLAAISADIVERILLVTDAADERMSPYARSVLASVLVLACFAVIIVTANVDAKIIYQAF
jgi:D-alanyl-lipoteichoic acid acyltransferase DltB (MBOAT superfamily)